MSTNNLDTEEVNLTKMWLSVTAVDDDLTEENIETPVRPTSAMSQSGSSKIPVPRLNRSASLRSKSISKTNVNDDTDVSKIKDKYRSPTLESPTSTKLSRTKADVNSPRMFRSASFVSSRGMRNAQGHLTSPRPPETTRSLPRSDPFKRFSYVSPYSKKAIASERKSQSYAGVNSSCRHNNPHCHHIIQTSSPTVSKRPNFLALSPVTAPEEEEVKGTDTPHTPSSPCESHFDEQDDADSVKSFDSVNSAMSCDTAMRSLFNHKNRKYVVHCRHNPDLDPDDYLTPTQRAARRIRELKAELSQARKEIYSKQEQISQLTRELVLVRLHSVQQSSQSDTKDAPNSPVSPGRNQRVMKQASPDSTSRLSPKVCRTPPSAGSSEPELQRLAHTPTLNEPPTRSSPVPVNLNSPTSMADTVDSVDISQRSLADSGNYDDLASPCLSIKDHFDSARAIHSIDNLDEEDAGWAAAEAIEMKLRQEHEQRINEMKRNSLNEYNELKERHNDKVEALLAKLSEANLRYFELRPEHERCLEKLRVSEASIKKLQQELEDSEKKHQKTYLQMFLKGQQSAKLEANDNNEDANLSNEEEESTLPEPNKTTVAKLVKQLTHAEEELEKMKVLYKREVSRSQKQARSRDSTSSDTPSCSSSELDPEVTLQFLKSAIYYFLTDKDNSKGHLRAIESILGYTSTERKNIEKLARI